MRVDSMKRRKKGNEEKEVVIDTGKYY